MIRIKDEYVSFETSKLLKEAGFDVPCRGIYRTNQTGDYSFTEYNMKQTVDDLSWNTGDGFQYEYLAPTQALAARWLCEYKMIEISTAYCRRRKSWYYQVGYLDCEDEDVTFGFDYASRQYAMEAGLQEAIKLIKK